MLTNIATPVPAGLLYYSQLNSILRVEAKPNEIRALIIARNELAGYLSAKRKVPSSWMVAPSLPLRRGIQSDTSEFHAKADPETDIEDTGTGQFLPATIDNPRECRSCYAVDSCMLYRKVMIFHLVSRVALTPLQAVDQVPETEEDPIAELYAEKSGHMSEADGAFFRKWETLLTVEEQEIGRFRSQLWTMTAASREKTGR